MTLFFKQLGVGEAPAKVDLAVRRRQGIAFT
jgi:hypothetical protein